MDELECMRIIDESLKAVDGEAARLRIATWVAAKYDVPTVIASATATTAGAYSTRAQRLSADTHPDQIAGIAKLSGSGEVQLTIRDLKAKSANDAAVRLMHVAIWAAGKLTGEPSLSSKKSLVPLLRKYRCYDGNTRTAIAREKGLVREGDQVSLDIHAEQFAEKIANEILDPDVEGRWKPGSAKRRSFRSIRTSGNEVA